MNFDKVTAFLDSLAEEKQAPGVDCIITRNHQRIYRHFSGKSDIENNIPINGNESYMIFSMTKMFTCVCALQLLEKGKYKLDDPVSMYLPEFAQMHVKSADGEPVKAKTPITVRHLFSMTAGLNYALDDSFIADAVKNEGGNTRCVVASFSKKILGFEPGAHYQYSLCHDVIGALIEIWSGCKFSE